MLEGRAHRQVLPQPKGGRTGSASLDESRPAVRTPDKGCSLCRLQKGRAHHCSVLEGASGADPRSNPEKESKRHVGAGKEEAALPDFPGLQVSDHGNNLPSTGTGSRRQPEVYASPHPHRSSSRGHPHSMLGSLVCS